MKRRVFLGAGLGAALARAADQPVGVGVIGVGNRGAHVLGLVLQQPDVKVTALCDLKPDRLDKAASAAAKHNPATMTDYRKLIERPDVNAVFIESPCDLHVEMAIAALKAGKHIYCEKPVGITPASIAELLNAAKGSKTVFCVGQQMRSFKSLNQAIDRIRDGVLGDVIYAKAQRHSSADLDHTLSSAEWFFDAKRSGDVLVEMSVHNLDACNWAIGGHPERAAGFGGTLLWKNDPPGRTNMDGYTLSYDYANGVKLSFTQVFFHPSGLPNGGQYTNIYGTKGAVSLDNFTFYPIEKGAAPVVLAEPEKERDMPHVAAFFEAIRTGSKPPADLTVGATAALTAILGREAIYTQKVTAWKDLGVPL